MYLLNHIWWNQTVKQIFDLHSTMYLLNHTVTSSVLSFANAFTFHYVSIKSYKNMRYYHNVPTFTFHYVSIKSINLHIMTKQISIFTFHYVSIKSSASLLSLMILSNLHSTMYLLNRRSGAKPTEQKWIYIPLCIY